MSSAGLRSVLVIVSVCLNMAAIWLAVRDRDRRERLTRQRPQPLHYSREAKALTGLSMLAIVGAVLTYVV